MKKKLALLMAAIMTVAMVPMTAFASTKLTAVDEISTAAATSMCSHQELNFQRTTTRLTLKVLVKRLMVEKFLM